VDLAFVGADVVDPLQDGLQVEGYVGIVPAQGHGNLGEPLPQRQGNQVVILANAFGAVDAHEVVVGLVAGRRVFRHGQDVGAATEQVDFHQVRGGAEDILLLGDVG